MVRGGRSGIQRRVNPENEKQRMLYSLPRISHQQLVSDFQRGAGEEMSDGLSGGQQCIVNKGRKTTLQRRVLF